MIIYKTTNLINGKIYIGKDSKNSDKYLGSGLLLNKAIKKYGIENFKKEVLEYCKDNKQLNEREIFWIKELDSLENGYNLALGGSGGITRKTKPIYQYTLTGEFVKEWVSAAEAGRFLNTDASTILKVCKGKLLTFKGFLWKYDYAIKIDEHIDPRGNKLYQYDTNGLFIKEWKSAYEVQRLLGIDNAALIRVLKHPSQKVGGFYWQTNKQEKIKIEDDKRKRKGKRGARGKYKPKSA